MIYHCLSKCSGHLLLSIFSLSINTCSELFATLYLALTKYQSLRDIQFLKTWFYRILVNESLTYLRTNKQLLTFSSEIEEIPHSDLYNLDELNLYQEVNKLPDKLKTIIILRFYEEMTLEEISTITNTNLSTVKSRLYQALKLLKLNYKEIDPYE